MAANINKWSETPASNATADPAINWAEGQAPSTVNDSARQMMAAIAADRDDTRGGLTYGGTASAWTLGTNAVNTTQQNGLRVSGKVANVNAANFTLNVDSIGAKNVYVETITGYVQPGATATFVGQHVAFEYDASLNSSAGGWVMQPASNGRIVNIQLLTVTGTYTRTAGASVGDLYLVGGAGAGGGCPATGAGQTSVGGGGGGGAFTLKKGVTLPASCSYTIGAGGTGVSGAAGNAGGQTIFNTTITANGGSGGQFSGPSNVVFLATGSAGGTVGASGDVNIAGNTGTYGLSAQSGVQGGPGGPSIFMGWGKGGGGNFLGASSSANAGANGGAGGIFVVEYA